MFVSEAPKGESKGGGPFTTAGQAESQATAAGDQYIGPPGPFLPPGTTLTQAGQNFLAYVLAANRDLRTALGCNALSGRAKTRCLARQAILAVQYPTLQQRLNSALATIGSLSLAKQAAAAQLLAIHLQRQELLATNQAARQANCARAAYASAHRRICARVTPAGEAQERLRLGTLQLAELEAFLAT